MKTEPKKIPRPTFAEYIAKVLELNPDLTMSDMMFIWEQESQHQCDEYKISMYQRMEIIAKAFNSFL